MKTNHTSYGIIPIYKKDNQVYICCVHNEKSDEWGLPKGTPEINETALETAKRELAEETGISDCEILGGKYFSEKYIFNQDGIEHHKQNVYVVGMVEEMKEKTDEIDSKNMKWINIKDSDNFFKFDTIKKILKEVYEYVNKFPLVNKYYGRSGEDYLFEYYEADSIEHIPQDKMSQVQIFAFHKDKLLIVNNANKFNTYSPVGGSIEPGEKPEECLIRELQEESNMRPITFKLIGYQTCTNLSQPKKPVDYQLRYFAQIELIGPFTPDCDPDGDVTELLEINPQDYKKYFDWGQVGDSIVKRALEFYSNSSL